SRSYSSRSPPTSSLFPYTTLFRSTVDAIGEFPRHVDNLLQQALAQRGRLEPEAQELLVPDDQFVFRRLLARVRQPGDLRSTHARSEEHTSELQSRENLVCRLLLEK